jgi:myo-inositol 2-dehydrogenase/D-chiro-inositol 1-dehydrogenase
MFRLGLVGAGRMGQTHLAAVKDSTTVSVTAVVEPRPDVAEALTAEGYTVYSSIAGLLDAGGVDGFLVATPSGFHVDVIRQIAPAGLPILSEKPCGLSVEDASAVKEIVERAGVRLQIGYWRRFVPAMIELKKDIESGRFGRLLFVHASQWDYRPPAPEFRNSSGGILTDMGVHEIDVIHWLTGEAPRAISGSVMMSTTPGVVDEDSAVFSLVLPSGTLGIATLGRFYPEADFVGIEVMGEEDHVRIEVLAGVAGEVTQMAALRAQAEAFATGGVPDGATIDDAITALRVVSLYSPGSD